MAEFLTAYGWLIWLALVLVFVIVEMLTLDLIFLMLGIGSLGGLVAHLLGAPVWLQIVIAAVVAIALLLFLRPPLLRHLKRGGDPAKSNVDALPGLSGRAITAITHDSGQARLANGDVWTARIPDVAGVEDLRPGEQLRVLSISGATAIVVPFTKGPPSDV